VLLRAACPEPVPVHLFIQCVADVGGDVLHQLPLLSAAFDVWPLEFSKAVFDDPANCGGLPLFIISSSPRFFEAALALMMYSPSETSATLLSDVGVPSPPDQAALREATSEAGEGACDPA
jgi:hypothetical protein